MKDILKNLSQIKPDSNNSFVALNLGDPKTVNVYPNSLNEKNNCKLFIARDESGKSLFIAAQDKRTIEELGFEGAYVDSLNVKRCNLTHYNATQLRELFDFTKPGLVGLPDSFGFGDRLGLSNAAHVRTAKNFNIKPIFAQQSIRELERTQREAEEVMDVASWAVFQEGYRDGFGADADHLKTEQDVDRMVKAGYTFFTIDPSAFVENEADTLPENALIEKCKSLPWNELEDTFESFLKRYENTTFEISSDFKIGPTKIDVLRGLTKYGGVLAHTKKLYFYLKEAYPAHPSEFEISVDETDSVTSPFEHFLIANELKRLNVEIMSLAPRFIGDFEKGIDYKGDLDSFREEYIKHIKISAKLGSYKISIHSGSDKFGVYKTVGDLDEGNVHVKTAGTSYLEALRTIAEVDTALFREILAFSKNHYENEKKTYHVSAQLDKVPDAKTATKDQLLELFEQDSPRQVLHVTFGKVLTTKENDEYLFRNRILQCLEQNEEAHYKNIVKHFTRHLEPLVQAA